ncbi:acyltransferase family protein [Halomonas sp. M4R5S39]|uniref:acyltransferase family protein n=1 Tax=Halomonas kalidii TaxID=3043293 RepID=UPI0024A98373|nr:acyltransferase family protein [Halomonas kalidii]MDI5985284.1 acyltransferase family protein [Halomonas kalidii]
MNSAPRNASRQTRQDRAGCDTHARDRYPDALRAGALLVVVFGHWIATLPRLENGLMTTTDHLLLVWTGAGVLTWVLQVVPLFVFVSAAVSADGAQRRLEQGHRQLHWWAGRALGLARPTVTYLAVLVAFVILAAYTGGRLLGPLNHSLTVHLWFLMMLLGVQALLPLSVWADRRWGLKAVAGLLLIAATVDVLRAGLAAPADLLELGTRVTGNGGGIGWLNAAVVWLLPQQLGIAWKRGRFSGLGTGLALLLLGLLWLAAAVASGYPVAMVDGAFGAPSNLLPPTLALVGVMWVQVGAVLACEGPVRRLLERRRVDRVVTILGALGMPLYLWHKLAELPAAWLGERLGLPIDAGIPGEVGFWLGRLWWILLCIVAVAPVMVAVVTFEMSRKRDVVSATGTPAILAGGAALLGGIIVSLALGALPGAIVGLAGVAAASWLLRAHPQPTRGSWPPPSRQEP